MPPPAKLARVLGDHVSTSFARCDAGAGLAKDAFANSAANLTLITVGSSDRNSPKQPINLLISIDSATTKEVHRSGHGSCYDFDTTAGCATSGGSMGGFLFTENQLRELQMQALVFRYMACGASVPQDLVLSVKASLFATINPDHHHHSVFLHHLNSASDSSSAAGMKSNCSGGVTAASASTSRALVGDREPGRCRRTDGKKWRCARDVVPYHKYCERHIHRGRHHHRRNHLQPPPDPFVGSLTLTPSVQSLRTGCFTASSQTQGLSVVDGRSPPNETAELLVRHIDLKQEQIEEEEEPAIHHVGIDITKLQRPRPNLLQFFDENPSVSGGSDNCELESDGIRRYRRKSPKTDGYVMKSEATREEGEEDDRICSAERDDVEGKQGRRRGGWAWMDGKKGSEIGGENGRKNSKEEAAELAAELAAEEASMTTELSIWTASAPQKRRFPASPIVCKSFLQEASANFSGWGRCLDLRSPALKLPTASPTHI